MDGSAIGSWIAFLFLVGQYVIVPLGGVGLSVAIVVSRRKMVWKLGLKIGAVSSAPIRNTGSLVFGVIVIAGSVIALFSTRSVVATVVLVLGLTMFFPALQTRMMYQYRGVYENGAIVFDTPIYWKDVHSWSVSDRTISLLMNNGIRSDINLVNGLEKVEQQLSLQNAIREDSVISRE